MVARFLKFLALALGLAQGAGWAPAQDPAPLHQRIDALLGDGGPGDAFANPSSDAEFLRRVFLDFAGDLPSPERIRAFLADSAPDKRTRVIDELLASPRYASHMADQFAILLMERRGEHALWRSWLEASFAANKPWDQIVREIVRADHRDEPNRGAAFFYTKRLEKYGQNPTDFPGLTRDVGRLFLGLDLQCAECHNHRTVDSYLQSDFQGLFATYRNLKLYQGTFPAVEEGVMEGPLEFSSVFGGRKQVTGPRLPGLGEVEVVTFTKDEGWELPPDRKAKSPGIPKFSALAHFATQMPASPTFAPNIANRLWFLLIGRGLVEPLDLHHPDNPPSHPELLELLADTLVADGYDLRGFLRELALTRVYQRAGTLRAPVPPGSPSRFAAAIERPLSAEQFFRILLTATGTSPQTLGPKRTEELEKKIFAALSGEPKEPLLAFSPSLKGILLLLNDPDIAALLSPAEGNLAAALRDGPDDSALVERLFLQVFSRPPTAEEQSETRAYLGRNEPTREQAITDLLWAMISSTEFATNH